MQDSPGAQAWPHEPQLRGSLPTSVHSPAQSVEHCTHAPEVQVSLAEQT